MTSMENYLIITYLNDFIFCPYSIYLHQIYEAHDTELYYEDTQQKGLDAHQAVDYGVYSSRSDYMAGLSVFSTQYQLMGKIDLYKIDKQILIERKREIKEIYTGYLYQLYAQYFCMCEMGYVIDKLCFYSVVDKKTYWMPKPLSQERELFEQHLERIQAFNPEEFEQTNKEKCRRCIYSNLCEKNEL